MSKFGDHSYHGGHGDHLVVMVTSSNPRLRTLKAGVARLKARIERLRARVEAKNQQLDSKDTS